MSLSELQTARRLPPLETGDQPSSEEFLRRYEAMPHLKKAELIDGVVYVASPTPWDFHAVPHAALNMVLGAYWAHTPGIQAGISGTVRLDVKNVPQPDLTLIILPKHGGQVRFDEDGYIAGAPELVGEISASTASIDLNKKFRLYLRHQVSEYIVWRVYDEQIDWFIRRDGRFERLQPDGSGVYRSEAFPGLWVDAQALIRLALLRALQVLQQGIASPEHADFVGRLAQAVARPPAGA
jgi:Uma2 family endonuclease